MFALLEAHPDTQEPTVPLPNSPPPDLVAPEDLVDEMASAFTRRDRDDARIVRQLRQAGETGAFRRDGYSSLSALLNHRMSLHPGETQRLVTRANGLAQTPLVATAYEKGEISGAQVDVILEASFTAPEQFSEAEAELVHLARATPLVRDLRKRLDYWLDQVATDDLALDRSRVRDVRALNMRRDGEMIRVSGWFDIESGERVRATLEPGPPAEGDDRSTPARRADQFIDILNGASNRPDILVHVSVESLTDQGPAVSQTGHGTSPSDQTPRVSETGYGTFLTADEIKRLTCDASLTRVIFDAESQPMDVGRTHRLITPALRAAVCARDMGCVFPNCDRPPNWCDAHHLRPWVDGGETSIHNLVLLCRHHHVLIHQAGWTITGRPGQLTFYRPDGTRLGDRPPPRLQKHPSATSQAGHLSADYDLLSVAKELSATKLLRGP